MDDRDDKDKTVTGTLAGDCDEQISKPLRRGWRVLVGRSVAHAAFQSPRDELYRLCNLIASLC